MDRAVAVGLACGSDAATSDADGTDASAPGTSTGGGAGGAASTHDGGAGLPAGGAAGGPVAGAPAPSDAGAAGASAADATTAGADAGVVSGALDPAAGAYGERAALPFAGRYDSGSFSGPITDVLDVYDPATDQWTRAASMPRPRGG